MNNESINKPNLIKDNAPNKDLCLQNKIYINEIPLLHLLINTPTYSKLTKQPCWWKHGNSSEQNLDFQQNPVNLAPPINPQTAPQLSVTNWPPLSGPMSQTMPQMIHILEQNLLIMKNMWNMINKPTQKI